jgi:hypothetical protein
MSATLLLMMLLSQTEAATIYKCKSAAGLVFQQQPCKGGMHMKTIVVPDSSRTPPPAPSNQSSSSSTPDKPATPVPKPPQETILPSALYYRCTSHDDSTYFSASPVPKRHLVPAWVAYGSNPVPDRNAMVWVEDECQVVPVKEACDHYREQLQLAEAKVRKISSSDKANERERNRLITLIKARCGG